ncbi:TIGR00730 family Rossman fold protein [Mesorhizobium sp. B2-5-13]|uniref:LOG family protein n=1 Tax=unclassified Mesorhizobium TaxID=325217 RepID=UPI001125CFD5|nr:MULTISPECIES: TIGR00730 family Rossman fold protein [unclassified Mesorhizobium]TPJ32984.1 TIGR00730 family Rossman fold protein [Mesorhizobium sp. B2-6-5]TPJ85289.1 TIGR00730 family Rossman fold protein [Mesorhizobium sp. B2-5-13]TPK49505.1 TIGR00730 family Rossman fold protein [Mesorhizobium sp. B2-5-5]TPL92757.1 TIGR00730 family Rossman fold protein [Mesorhizobium sp. B2-3-11]
MNTIRSVCVYCGSSPGRDEIYAKAGHLLGRSIAKAGLRLVYGGGTKGIMGAVAEGALKAGGKVTGIIPRFLINKEATETALDRLDELLITDNMHERKHKMFEKSDAFVALPGGIGTVEEIVEIMTWAQLGHHRKPIVFGNVNGFWDPMTALLDHMAAEGFIHTAQRVKPLIVNDPEAIVAAIMVAGSSVDSPTEGVQSVIDKM